MGWISIINLARNHVPVIDCVLSPWGLALLPAFMAMRRRPVLIPIIITVCVMLGSATVWLREGTDDLARALGRDVTFTGRVGPLAIGRLVIGKSPWLGHGYGTSWVTGGEDASTDIATCSEWNAPDAYDEFLTIASDLGLFGLALFVIGCALTVGRAIVGLRSDQTIEALWPPLFLFLSCSPTSPKADSSGTTAPTGRSTSQQSYCWPQTVRRLERGGRQVIAMSGTLQWILRRMAEASECLPIPTAWISSRLTSSF